ncbi:hypothetical protein BD0115_14330 [Helicobacter pylori]
MSAGYQIGEAVQMVKNTGELKNLNDKYEQLSQSLAQLASLKQSIQTANNIQAVNNALSDLKSFASNNHTNKETSPIYNTAKGGYHFSIGFLESLCREHSQFFCERFE